MFWRSAFPFLRTLAPAPRFPASRSFTSSRPVLHAPPVFQAQRAAVFPFGVPSNDPSQALFNDLDLTIHDEDCWAILAPSSSSPTRAALLATIQHQARFHPISSASHPILATLPPVDRPAEEGGPRERTVEDLLQFVSFKTRLGRSGAFDDYTARYYSIRDEDKLTVRQHLKDSTGASDEVVAEKAKDLQMTTLLDLPLITLSNGQTRRARILRALLAKPELLILEEPFTGLDASSRELLSSLLSSLHAARSPRVLLVLRPQDVLPPFVTHIALADASPETPLRLGRKDEILATKEARELLAAGEAERAASKWRKEERQAAAAKKDEEVEGRKTIVQLTGVNISYGRPAEGQEERKVLKDVNWTIREGERWVLAGHNGSGKSTLLALLLGDHPRSFTEDIELFGKPRLRQATATLQANIGHVSPEIFNAFPRRYGPEALSAYDAIVTGFESVYSYRKATPDQAAAISSLLSRISHPLLTPSFLDRPFASLSPGEQSLILLLRALVKQPPLLVFDEPFSGMDKATIEKVQRFIDEELDERQSVVLITHFEEEVPKSVGRLLRLENGEVVERV
ncbi:putative ABC transporter ATP-binding protein [Rhodotorula toruloides]|nr:putative ABC transporter ATP-binding protein [Rhodotorula toruloides]